MPKKITNFEVGDLVFAKVKGFPAWPARIREKKGKKLDVIFFGTNETAVVKPEECSDYLENRKSFTQKYIKKRNYVSALQEIEDAYNESVGEAATKPEVTVDTPPSDENKTVESLDNTVINEPNESVVSLDDINNETMETDIDNTDEVKVDKKRSPSPISMETTPSVSITTPQSKSEIVSSRGRKIKPKRFMDDDFNEDAATPPVAKRIKIRSTESMDPEPNTAAEAGTAAEGEVILNEEEGLAVQYLNSVLILNRENEKSLAVYTVRDMKLRLAKLEEILSPSKKDDLRNKPDLLLPSRHPNSVLLVSHRNCVFGLYMDSSRPAEFNTKEDEIQYEVRSGNEIMALYCEIESDEKKITDLPEKIVCRMSTFEQHLCLTREMLDLTGTQSEKKIASLRIEAYIMKLIYDVREAVSLDHNRLDLPKSVAIMRQLNKYELNRIMLMKHPIFVRTVMKLANYKGLQCATRPWTSNDDRRAELVRAEANKLKTKISTLLNIRNLVWPEFLNVVQIFRNAIHSSSTPEFLEITSEEEYENMVLLEKRKQRKRIADLEAESMNAEQKKPLESVPSDSISTSEAAPVTTLELPELQKTNVVVDNEKKKSVVIDKKKKPILQLSKKPKDPKSKESKNIEVPKFKSLNSEHNVEVTISKKQDHVKRNSKDDNLNKKKPSDSKTSQNNETIKAAKTVNVEVHHNVLESAVQKDTSPKANLKPSDTDDSKPILKTEEGDKSTGIKIADETKINKKSVLEDKPLLDKIESKSIKSPTPAVSITPIGPAVFQKSASFTLKSQINMPKTVLFPKGFMPKSQSKLVVVNDGSTPKIQIPKGQVAAGKAQFSKLPSSVKLQLIKDGSQKIQHAKTEQKLETDSSRTSPSKST